MFDELSLQEDYVTKDIKGRSSRERGTKHSLEKKPQHQESYIVPDPETCLLYKLYLNVHCIRNILSYVGILAFRGVWEFGGKKASRNHQI